MIIYWKMSNFFFFWDDVCHSENELGLEDILKKWEKNNYGFFLIIKKLVMRYNGTNTIDISRPRRTYQGIANIVDFYCFSEKNFSLEIIFKL